MAMLARFVCFSFAAADILIETDAEGRVRYATGATSLLNQGQPSDGVKLCDIVEDSHRLAVMFFADSASKSHRIGPLEIRIAGRRAQLSGWRLEESSRTGWAIDFGDAGLAAQSPEALAGDIGDVIERQRANARPVAFRMFQLCDDPAKLDDHESFFGNLQAVLKAGSLDQAGGLLSDRVMVATCEHEDDVVELGSVLSEICFDGGLNGDGLAAKTFEGDTDLSGAQIVAALQAIAEHVDAPGQMPEEDTLSNAAQSIATERRKRLSALSAVIQGRRFEPHTQVIVDAATGEEAGYELLIRLPGGQAFEPGVLMAEKTGLVRDLDHAMLDFAIESLENGVDRPGLTVNLSGATLCDVTSSTAILKRLANTRIERHRLAFEVTESARIEDFETASRTIAKIRERGCSVALDDFGSGACGLAYLQRLPCDRVKIEASMIDEALRTRDGFAVARAAFKMFASLNKAVTVERIEEESQAMLARWYGDDRLQGWLFGKAMPLSALVEIHKPRAARAGQTETFG